jgi:phosphatidylglycerol lysyltransferase
VRRRIDSAYFASIGMLAIGMVASLGKGFDYEEAAILGVMLILFIPARKHFYRKSALMQLDLSPQWLALVAMVVLGSTWLGFFSFKHVEYSNELWWQFALNGDASRFLRSLIAILIVVTGVTAYRLLTRTAFNLALPKPDELDKALRIVRQSGETAAYLALTGDKYLLWSQSGNSFLMFDATRQFWVAMGDPVGVAEEYEELTWSFLTLADQHNAKVAFYQIGTLNVPLYLELGLALIKLGTEAKVPLASFSLEGKKRSGLRYSFNKLQREGLSFEIVPVSGVDAILHDLEIISGRWMKDKKAREKRFSLGYFSADYLRRCPAAIIRKEGSIIAFANLWELENKEELSIDMMRYLPEAPNGVMEFLIISLLLWGKEHQYHWFSLGMAPLSGLERHPLAPLWNKIGNTIFRFGHEFYNFEGLYQYKNKFDPVWQPRYLAAPAGLSMASALLSVTTLISGNIKGVFSK